MRIDEGILDRINEKHAPARRNADGTLTKDSLNTFMEASEKAQGPWYAVHHGYEIQICDAPSDKFSRTGVKRQLMLLGIGSTSRPVFT